MTTIYILLALSGMFYYLIRCEERRRQSDIEIQRKLSFITEFSTKRESPVEKVSSMPAPRSPFLKTGRVQSEEERNRRSEAAKLMHAKRKENKKNSVPIS